MQRPDRETLQKLYLEQRLNSDAIGKIYGVSGRTIRQWMKLADIKLLGPSHLRMGVTAYWNVGRQRSAELRKKISDAKVGSTPWNKGAGHVEAICKTCGAAFRDKPYRRALYCNSRCRDTARGASHFNFKGEAAGYVQRQRNWADYRDWRAAVLAQSGYQCRKCGQVGGKLTSHHLNSWAAYPEQRYNTSNGVALCWPCHWSFHREYGHRRNTEQQFNEWLTK